MSKTEQVTTMTSSTATNVNAEWVDIIGPTIPSAVFPWWWAGVTVAILSVLLLILYTVYQQPRFRARVQLMMLRLRIKRDTTADYRAAALAIARIIGARLRHSSPQTIRTEQEASLHRQLNYACYSPTRPTKTETLSLLNTALIFLKHKDHIQHADTPQVLS